MFPAFLGEGLRLSHPRLLVVCSLLGLLVLQALQFRSGYRLTADDAAFLQFVWHGWGHVWAEADAVARFSGRIGHYVMTPLNALGAWLSGQGWGRALILLLYYSVFGLTALYLSQLLTRRAVFFLWTFMMLVMVAMHPLAYEHMPPNAYPLQNTLPFLVVLLVRLGLLHGQRSNLCAGRGTAGCDRRWPLLYLFLYLALAAAMLVSEFVFLFATALMAADHLANAAWPRPGVRQQRVSGVWLRPGHLAADTVVVTLVLAVYVGFRLYHPSEYEGNDPSGLAEPARFLKTALLHLSAGTVFHRLAWVDWSFVSVGTWVLAALVAGATWVCAWMVTRGLPLLSARAALGLLVVAFLLMFYQAAPLAATERQQQWCLELELCGYLDSRVSFLGVGALVFALVSLLGALLNRLPVRVLPVLVAPALAVTAGLNYAANGVVSADMRDRSAPWGRAQALACSVDEAREGHWLASGAIQAVDPGGRVSMHPQTDRRLYWLEYVNYLRGTGLCGTGERAMPLRDAAYSSFSWWASDAERMLLSGWWQPETWGVWSVGTYSRLRLPVNARNHRDAAALRVDFRPYLGPSVPEQQVDVMLDGVKVARWSFSLEQGLAESCCSRQVTLPATVVDRLGEPENGWVVLSFRLANARVPGFPGEGQDERPLALALQSVEWLDRASLERSGEGVTDGVD